MQRIIQLKRLFIISAAHDFINARPSGGGRSERSAENQYLNIEQI
jgi:hypothetical protein